MAVYTEIMINQGDRLRGSAYRKNFDGNNFQTLL